MRNRRAATAFSRSRRFVAVLLALLFALLNLAAAGPHAHDGRGVSGDALRAAAAHHHGAGAPGALAPADHCPLCLFAASAHLLLAGPAADVAGAVARVASAAPPAPLCPRADAPVLPSGSRGPPRRALSLP
jgi:hypothetical protein